MKVWALSDPHLSFTRDKPMHIFGEHWRRHWVKIERQWRKRVDPTDVVLVTGDVSWASRFKQAMADLAWLDGLPGFRKLLVRGNHDAWWPGEEAEASALPSSLLLLRGEAVEIQGVVFCGTGGWVSPEDPYFEPLDRPSYERELASLRVALERAAELEAGRGIHVLIHYPPFTSHGKPTAFDKLLREYPVKTVTFGHFHLAEEWRRMPTGMVRGIHYVLASADYLEFAPVRLPI
jgi:predicted phosphohydrolase